MEHKNKKMKYLVIVLIIVLIIVLSFFFILNNDNDKDVKNTVDENNVPTISPTFPPEPQSDEFYEYVDDNFATNELNISKLIDLLPYQGNNFSMRFQISDSSYIVTIPENNKTDGLNELKTFMRSNGINDIDSIRNLIIEYK